LWRIVTLLLYNSDPSYRLSLFRIWSVQSLLRSENLRCSHLGSPKVYTAGLGSHIYIIYRLDIRDTTVSPDTKGFISQSDLVSSLFRRVQYTPQQFIRACRCACEIISPFAEKNLTKLLITKLRNRTYYSVEDEPCNTVTQLIDLLTGAFGSLKTIDRYHGELSIIYLKPHEHIIDFISRVKDLHTSFLDIERRVKGTLRSPFRFQKTDWQSDHFVKDCH